MRGWAQWVQLGVLVGPVATRVHVRGRGVRVTQGDMVTKAVGRGPSGAGPPTEGRRRPLEAEKDE